MSASSSSTAQRLHRRAVRLEVFTVSWNVLEAVVAIVAGVVAGSTALIAFGMDSVIEVSSAVALLWRLWRAGAGASATERGRAERRALLLVALTFVALALYIAVDSVVALLNRSEPESSPVGLGLAVLSLVVMPALGFAKRHTGQRMDSAALEADAVETFVCAYLSFALLLGIGLNALLGWWWTDPVAALAMLPVIVWQAWETWEESRESE